MIFGVIAMIMAMSTAFITPTGAPPSEEYPDTIAHVEQVKPVQRPPTKAVNP